MVLVPKPASISGPTLIDSETLDRRRREVQFRARRGGRWCVFGQGRVRVCVDVAARCATRLPGGSATSSSAPVSATKTTKSLARSIELVSSRRTCWALGWSAHFSPGWNVLTCVSSSWLRTGAFEDVGVDENLTVPVLRRGVHRATGRR
jgi:hypothetical protein